MSISICGIYLFMNPTLYNLEFHKICEHLVRLAEMEAARERLSSLKPSQDIKWVNNELARVEEIRGLINRGGNFSGGGLRDVRLIMKKAAVAGAVLSCEELLLVLHHLSFHSATSKVLTRERERMPKVCRLARPLEPLPDLEEQLSNAISPEATVRDKASPELARLRRAVTNQQKHIRQKLTAMIPRLNRQKSLRESSFSIRSGRYVLPVRSDSLGKVRGIIQDRSATGGTLFVEPESIIDAGNELRTLELAERDEVRRILRELTGFIRKQLNQIQANFEVITEIDCLWAKARLADELDAYPPKITDENKLCLLGARHPILVLADNRNVVPLNMELGDDWTTLVISGPNAGGKTVALKCVGLMCVMAACGLPVPTLPGTEIPLYTDFQVDIGDQQSIVDDLSTFTARMSRLNEILTSADRKTLVLIDEIGAGTDPQEGASLSIAILEKLTERKIPTVVTTHHGTLKAFAHSTAGCVNGSMEFDMETFEPTFRFRHNIPGSSYALEIAGRVGLPENIIDRAREVLGSERTHLEELIISLSQKVRHYESIVIDEEKRIVLADAQEEAYRKKLDRLKTREQELKKRASEDAENLLWNARSEIESIVKEIKESDASSQSVREARKKLRHLGNKVSEELGNKVEDQSDILFPSPKSQHYKKVEKEPEVGDHVTIDGTTTTGEILTVGSRGQRICVAVGSVQLWVKRERVTVIEPPQRTDVQPMKTFVKLPDVPLELDIRGLDAPSALQRVDRYIADGHARGRERLGIIHGKGLGILAHEVQKYLQNHDKVDSFRFGEQGEGDYGITLVNLK